MFITLEGCEGSGKSSLAAKLKERLENNNKTVLLTREPGGVPTAEEIRQILMYSDVEPMSQVLLFAAIRNEHLQKRIIPALNEYDYVICDRFVDSSIAYQGYAMGIDIDFIKEVNNRVIGANMPKLTLFLNLTPEKGLERIYKDEGREVTNMDKYDLEFHEEVYKGYIELAKQESNRIKSINADKTIEELVESALQVINETN